MKCLKSDQLSNAIKVAFRLFIALLRSSRASSADENSFCQAVSGTVPRCSQSQFWDSVIANLRKFLGQPGTV